MCRGREHVATAHRICDHSRDWGVTEVTSASLVAWSRTRPSGPAGADIALVSLRRRGECRR
ncbi:hypothetical protein ACN6K9_002649 [Streptomyces sp. SAS_267]|uniref:hypothetical protein n=1 Tax=Streptomyces sp. SAS_267 TaxID=3412750 RepID=UPI00403C9809